MSLSILATTVTINPSVTRTTSTTTRSTAAFPTSGLLGLDCPSLNGTSYTSAPDANGPAYTFKIFCKTDYTSAPNINHFNTTNINGCLDHCANYDTSHAPNTPCRGILFNSNIMFSLTQGGTCFLKSDVSNSELASLPLDTFAGGVLVNTSS